MKRMVLMAMVLVLAVTFGFSLAYNVKVSRAGEEDLPVGTMDRLRQVIENQQAIMQKLDEIKRELYIIKVRATR